MPRRDTPLPGQESVWDYPRPPAVETTPDHIVVVHANTVVADSTRAVRVLETAHAPAYYVPLADVLPGALTLNRNHTWCEFKGQAHYLDLILPGVTVLEAAWCYPQPTSGYELLRDTVCFYPQRVDRCEVAGEVVTPLAGSFYGDWPTSRVAGPFKGGPGTEWW